MVGSAIVTNRFRWLRYAYGEFLVQQLQHLVVLGFGSEEVYTRRDFRLGAVDIQVLMHCEDVAISLDTVLGIVDALESAVLRAGFCRRADGRVWSTCRVLARGTSLNVLYGMREGVKHQIELLGHTTMLLGALLCLQAGVVLWRAPNLLGSDQRKQCQADEPDGASHFAYSMLLLRWGIDLLLVGT